MPQTTPKILQAKGTASCASLLSKGGLGLATSNLEPEVKHAISLLPPSHKGRPRLRCLVNWEMFIES